ncbi:uncharacterized protein [Elaeis guineensis]|uniref:uncharacterized protein n=1 Tax=Elaeis guineensis var. tenera TaxID=51953 RepID=UPI003C6CED86
MELLEKSIVETICKLKKIFSPVFFDSMEHLTIYLPYEAKVGGPVQYRWMYLFNRCMHELKKKVRNKAKVEGSISEAYIVEKIFNFCSLNFKPHSQTQRTKVPQNNDGGYVDVQDRLSIFTYSDHPLGRSWKRYLSDEEIRAAELYVLLNCIEVETYIE